MTFQQDKGSSDLSQWFKAIVPKREEVSRQSQPSLQTVIAPLQAASWNSSAHWCWLKSCGTFFKQLNLKVYTNQPDFKLKTSKNKTNKQKILFSFFNFEVFVCFNEKHLENQLFTLQPSTALVISSYCMTMANTVLHRWYESSNGIILTLTVQKHWTGRRSPACWVWNWVVGCLKWARLQSGAPRIKSLGLCLILESDTERK